MHKQTNDFSEMLLEMLYVIHIRGRKQLIFSGRGQDDCNLMLYVTTKELNVVFDGFENFVGSGNCPVAGFLRNFENKFPELFKTFSRHFRTFSRPNISV